MLNQFSRTVNDENLSGESKNQVIPMGFIDFLDLEKGTKTDPKLDEDDEDDEEEEMEEEMVEIFDPDLLCDDVIGVIMDFMKSKPLFRMGWVSQRFRKMSSENFLWEKFLRFPSYYKVNEKCRVRIIWCEKKFPKSCHTDLKRLSNDLIYKICEYLDGDDLLSLNWSCQRIRRISMTESLWVRSDEDGLIKERLNDLCDDFSEEEGNSLREFYLTQRSQKERENFDNSEEMKKFRGLVLERKAEKCGLFAQMINLDLLPLFQIIFGFFAVFAITLTCMVISFAGFAPSEEEEESLNENPETENNNEDLQNSNRVVFFVVFWVSWMIFFFFCSIVCLVRTIWLCVVIPKLSRILHREEGKEKWRSRFVEILKSSGKYHRKYSLTRMAIQKGIISMDTSYLRVAENGIRNVTIAKCCQFPNTLIVVPLFICMFMFCFIFPYFVESATLARYFFVAIFYLTIVISLITIFFSCCTFYEIRNIFFFMVGGGKVYGIDDRDYYVISTFSTVVGLIKNSYHCVHATTLIFVFFLLTAIGMLYYEARVYSKEDIDVDDESSSWGEEWKDTGSEMITNPLFWTSVGTSLFAAVFMFICSPLFCLLSRFFQMISVLVLTRFFRNYYNLRKNMVNESRKKNSFEEESDPSSTSSGEEEEELEEGGNVQEEEVVIEEEEEEGEENTEQEEEEQKRKRSHENLRLRDMFTFQNLEEGEERRRSGILKLLGDFGGVLNSKKFLLSLNFPVLDLPVILFHLITYVFILIFLLILFFILPDESSPYPFTILVMYSVICLIYLCGMIGLRVFLDSMYLYHTEGVSWREDFDWISYNMNISFYELAKFFKPFSEQNNSKVRDGETTHEKYEQEIISIIMEENTSLINDEDDDDGFVWPPQRAEEEEGEEEEEVGINIDDDDFGVIDDEAEEEEVEEEEEMEDEGESEEEEEEEEGELDMTGIPDYMGMTDIQLGAHIEDAIGY